MKKHVWFNLEEHPEIFYGQYIVPNFISNSIAIRCSESHWLILSPGTEMLNQLPEGLDPDNHHLSIVFPNSFHHMGVKVWMERFPNHSLYASKKAAKRLATLGFSNIKELESQQPDLPSGYHFHEIRNSDYAQGALLCNTHYQQLLLAPLRLWYCC